jgi:putative endonuclease
MWGPPSLGAEAQGAEAAGGPIVAIGSAMPRDARQILGESGENLACAELKRLGYVILERRYRCRVGEIDIIARQGEVTVFVEVKTREGDEFGGGREAVTAVKQRTIARVALDYMTRHRLHDRPCRFDVVVVGTRGATRGATSGANRIEVIPNAFDAYM